MRPARIALIGDRSPHVLAHGRIPDALRQAAGEREVDVYWIASTDAARLTGLAGFDGIWAVPGGPYVDRDGVLHAVTVARTSGVPFLGTCGGFQHVLLEYARSVCGLDVEHAEQPLDAGAEPLIVALHCSLLGEEADVIVAPGTRAAQVLGAGRRVERFFCSYGLDDRFRARLEAAGLVFSAVDDEGTARMVELPGHPFFLASLFQPELSSDLHWAHPLIHAFTDAALAGVRV
ncbi:CTP synthase C-terminal region-related (seleno)protein [Cryptosporangium arvum]|uniref:CTP synthase (glutamine hydrolyzing) n=1 Tax=Cryptosporangium arvum DSM 44712 TaxID=927661 RepID=A0A010Z1C0_9ACTN|nr:hypothetical protein [Cryptosporangium arvum]EXG81223.1 CTP synthase (UTP-ammonia lyase) [Cryptosporangium arvum DSM 44712]